MSDYRCSECRIPVQEGYAYSRCCFADIEAFVDQAHHVIEADRAAGLERIRRDADVIAAQLTELLPADMRAAGMRFEWAEGE
ncbi:hypothetical protein ACWDBO_31480 [Streptomyces mirabilis]|uniref:hypothetical protein n=1 Tax=Streptomyces mirabilis TaxID=68239 RepID=UPI003328C3FF